MADICTNIVTQTPNNLIEIAQNIVHFQINWLCSQPYMALMCHKAENCLFFENDISETTETLDTTILTYKLKNYTRLWTKTVRCVD